MTIRLHIDRLVLDGWPLSGADAALLRRSVEQKLESLLEAGQSNLRTLPGGAAPAIQGAAITTGPDHSPTRLGAQIGGAVYSSLGVRQ